MHTPVGTGLCAYVTRSPVSQTYPCDVNAGASPGPMPAVVPLCALVRNASHAVRLTLTPPQDVTGSGDSPALSGACTGALSALFTVAGWFVSFVF